MNLDLEYNRYGLFVSENSLDLDIMYAREYQKTDINHIIILRKVNIVKTKVDDLYGQVSSNNKVYLPPIHLSGFVIVEDSSQSTYGSEKGLVRDDTGNLSFTVFLDELKEKNTDFDRGDIIEYNFSGNKRRFYEVVNANKITDTTKQSRGSYKPFQKTIIAIPVKEDVIHLFKESAE